MKLLNLLIAIAMLSLFTGCALFDGDPNTTIGNTTLGNSQVDVDLGDQKLFGSAEAYTIGMTAAQYAVYKKPTAAHSIKAKLLNVKEDVEDLQAKYPADQATALALAKLRQECGFWCNTVAGQQYLDAYILEATGIVSELAGSGEQISVQEVYDHLIAQIELIEATSQ